MFKFQYGWQSIFPVGGLGVEDQQWPPRISDLTACVCFFLGGGGGVGPKRKSTDQNQEHLMNWNKRFEILVPLFLLSCWRKSVESASCRLQKCAQNTGAYAKICHWSASVWALKWSKNCCTLPLRFSIHWFNIVFTNHSACVITYFGCTLFIALHYVKETLKRATRRRNVSG